MYSRLTWYTGYNRNLIKMSDYSKAENTTFHGPDEILELFSSLPATEHDPYSFCVDLMLYNVSLPPFGLLVLKVQCFIILFL